MSAPVTLPSGLTPAEAERLAWLAEECGEVVQLVGKILRFGYSSSHPDDPTPNRQLLRNETTDLLAAIRVLELEFDFPAGQCTHPVRQVDGSVVYEPGPTPELVAAAIERKRRYARCRENA